MPSKSFFRKLKPGEKSRFVKNSIVPKKAIANTVKQVMNRRTETKFWDEYEVKYAVGGAGSNYVQDLTLVPQGDTDTTRDGDKLTLTSLKLNYFIDPQSAQLDHYFRIIILQWHELTAATTPSATSILQNVSTDRDAILSEYTWDYKARFKIMYDRVHYIRPLTTNTGNYCENIPTQRISKFIKIPRKTIDYVAGGTNGNHHIFMVAFSCAVNGAAGASPYLNYNVRLTYKDS